MSDKTHPTQTVDFADVFAAVVDPGIEFPEPLKEWAQAKPANAVLLDALKKLHVALPGSAQAAILLTQVILDLTAEGKSDSSRHSARSSSTHKA